MEPASSSEGKKIVLIAIDGSPQAEAAFDCKFNQYHFYHFIQPLTARLVVRLVEPISDERFTQLVTYIGFASPITIAFS